MLDREIAFYKSLHELGVSTTFVTFGNYSDLELKNKISPIKICCNKWSLPRRLYELLIPLLFIKIFKNAHLIKSNQLFGAKFALLVSYIYNKPLIIRNGWLVSKTFEIKGADKKYLKKFNRLEKKLFKYADIIIVTTILMKNEIVKRYSINKSIIKVIPNYINSTIFKPISTQKIYDIIYVGRLEEEKNPELVLKTISQLDLKVLMIGQGSMKDDLQNKYKHLDDKIQWINSVPNNELPKYYNKSKIYIIPSEYENNPKSLLEAMSCGIPAIGANVMGINSIIDDEFNGILYDNSLSDLISKVKMILNDEDIRKTISRNALALISENYTLEKNVNEEFITYKKLACN